MNNLLGYLNISDDDTIADITDFVKFSGGGTAPLLRIIQGRPPTFSVRGSTPPHAAFCFSKDDTHVLEPVELHEFKELHHGAAKSHVFSPGTKEFDNAIIQILTHRDTVRKFFRTCHEKERLDVDFLNECLTNAQLHGSLSLLPNMWTPVLQVVSETSKGKTIQDFIEQESILRLLFQGKAEEWKKVTSCAECGRFFLSERNTAHCCSKVCRTRFNRRK